MIEEERKTRKIIFITESYVGGVRTHLNMLLTGLLDKGYNIQFFYSSRDEQANLPFQLAKISSDIIAGSNSRFFSKIIFLKNIIKRSRKWNGNAVIHAHGFIGFVASVVLKILGVSNKIVVTLHGGALHSQGMMHNLLKIGMSVMSKQVSCFVCVSEHDKYLHSLMGIPLNSLVVIENAINIKQIDKRIMEQSNPYSQKFINLVLISTFYRTKGVLELMVNLEKTRVFSPDTYHITLIGTGPLENEIVSIISNSEYLSKLVSVLGFISEPYHYMKWADVLLFPSRKETFGLVLFEAMYLQTKIVAHRQPITEIYLDSANLVDFNSLADVKEAVDSVLKKPKPNKQEDFIARYDIFFQNYVQLYTSL